jgi:hypothetical protein
MIQRDQLLTRGTNHVALDDPEKLRQFTLCAKLRLLPAIPAAWKDKKILKVCAIWCFALFLSSTPDTLCQQEDQKRAIDEWDERFEHRHAAQAEQRQALFQQQKARRAELEKAKEAKRDLAKSANTTRLDIPATLASPSPSTETATAAAAAKSDSARANAKPDTASSTETARKPSGATKPVRKDEL